jgi:hypothetical protein
MVFLLRQGFLAYLILNKKLWEELIACFPWYDTGHIENDASKSSIVACVFVNAETFVPSRCLPTIGGVFTELLPSNDREIFTEALPAYNSRIVGRFVFFAARVVSRKVGD